MSDLSVVRNAARDSHRTMNPSNSNVHHSELARLRDEKNEAQRQEHMAKAGEERLRRLVLKAAAASDPKVALDRLAREALDG
jgi:hypothetical protein